jgi:hypothetical protein
MESHGNNIKGCDMAPEMIEDAVKTAQEAFKNIPSNFDMAERERAKLIKQSFDKKYVLSVGLDWNVLNAFGAVPGHVQFPY